ncbi:hypothetical protein GWN26_02530, partial [Candidatus Saccharibacteria bacterium]|nr:hypothetical protein [Candidatus Saccharibacteria bacterium]NIV04453.1 hypothetical protein [Calditrichia bacterium]NIV73042.1 hypothetical protein [Calditrichia bacterium]NIV98074.1 hypothetical protein [Candidatus Saccharibacteria bacterium]NIW78365.1 hypothetical protein [Calditrichia bacterium]
MDRYLYLEEKERRYRENKFKYFVPNRHQKRFLGKTATCDELLFAGGNRTGKSTTGALGVTAWATGRYPSWWTGRRFDTPVRILVMGQTDVQLRKAAQRVLMGEEGQWGTGMLPKDTITDDKGKQTVYMKHDPRGCIDYIQVKSDFGGYSYIYFGTYGQGAEAQQGDELHAIWCDEPVDDDVYGELV